MSGPDADDLLRVLRGQLQERDRTLIEFTSGANCGEVAGQTVHHAHIHLIPRRVGDKLSLGSVIRA